MVTKEADIAAPMTTVFEVIEDIQLFVRLEENVQKVTITSDIKSGLGMKSHWEMGEPRTGAAWCVDEEIVHYDKPRQIAYVGEGAEGKSYAGVHNLSSNPDGSVHLTFNEVFHFAVDAEIERVVAGMVANVKKEAESRAGAKG
jgi:hypothetical protein